jgi:hypothetical protein
VVKAAVLVALLSIVPSQAPRDNEWPSEKRVMRLLCAVWQLAKNIDCFVLPYLQFDTDIFAIL